VLPVVGQQFAEAVLACSRREDVRFGFDDLNGLLSKLRGRELEVAVADRPSARLDSYTANYVAAMVELACAREGVRVPAWVRDTPPLAQPVFGSSLMSLRLHLLTHSPAAFRRRNIFIDSSLGAQV
jgi:hypothetical protein